MYYLSQLTVFDLYVKGGGRRERGRLRTYVRKHITCTTSNFEICDCESVTSSY